MPLPLRMFANMRNVRRLFRGPGTMQGSAYDEEILCPEEESALSPALFLPGQLDKITGTGVESTVAREIHALTRQEATHAATIAYHIRNAVLLGGSIYSGTWKHFLCDQSVPSTGGDVLHFANAALTSSNHGIKYFGHWLKDDCLRYLLAEQDGPPLSVTNAPLSDHMKQYASYFGQSWTPSVRARIDHLVAYQDFAQNSLKKKRYRILQNRLASHFANDEQNPALVYLKRGQTGVPRLISNESEIIETLSRNGFVVVDIASDNLQGIIASLMYAKIVVSIEGSHMCHCWFLPENSSGLIALQPPDRFTSNSKKLDSLHVGELWNCRRR